MSRTLEVILRSFSSALVLASVVGCERSQPRPPTATLSVVAANEPLAWLIERITAGNIRTTVLLKAGQSPHTYQPAPAELTAVAQADAFVMSGLGFERVLADKLFGPQDRGRLIDASPDGEAPTVDQSPSRADAHREDPHFWLNPRLLAGAAKRLRDGLVRIDPERRDEYDANLDALLSEIRAAEARIRVVLAPYPGGRIYVYHPAFGHFARAFGLEQVAVEHEGKPPGARRLAELIDQARGDQVRVIFCQPQASCVSAKTIARQIGASVELLDPLARDCVENLLHIAQRFRAALAGDVDD